MPHVSHNYCSCQSGGSCDGQAHRYRRAPKHGGGLIVHSPDCRGGEDHSSRANGSQTSSAADSVAGLYHAGDVRPVLRHRSKVERSAADYRGSARDRAQPEQPEHPYQAFGFRLRRDGSETPAPVAEPVRKTTDVPAPATRSPRGTLNTATRGGAQRALNVREAIHNGQATAGRPAAVLTMKQRRAAKRAAHRANMRGGQA